MTTIGTSHFTSREAAYRYYEAQGFDASDVARKITDGEIRIGKPALRDGETLTMIDNGTRYAITSKKGA